MVEWQLQFNYFLCASPIDSSHLLNNVYLFKYTVTQVYLFKYTVIKNALRKKVFLEINRIQRLGRQRADTNSIFKEITKMEQYQNITKDFLQYHINKLIMDEKIINTISRDKNSYKTNIESIDEKDQSFPVSPNDFLKGSIVTSINEKTPSIDFSLLNTNTPKQPQTNQ